MMLGIWLMAAFFLALVLACAFGFFVVGPLLEGEKLFSNPNDPNRRIWQRRTK